MYRCLEICIQRAIVTRKYNVCALYNLSRMYLGYVLSMPRKGGLSMDRKKIGRASKAKGGRGERELANKLKDYGYETRRGVQYCGRNGAADVIGLPGIHIECKRVERLNMYDAIDQAKRDCPDGKLPVVMSRKNNSEWLATMPLNIWMELYREYEAGTDLEGR